MECDNCGRAVPAVTPAGPGVHERPWREVRCVVFCCRSGCRSLAERAAAAVEAGKIQGGV